MRLIRFIITAGLLSGVLSACAGGGDGGSASDSNSSASTGVRLIHAALEAAPLQIFSSTNPAQPVQQARFGQETLYAPLKTGAQVLNLSVATQPANVIGTAALTVERNQRYSLLLYGDYTHLGLSTALVLDKPPQLSKDSSALRCMHAASGAGQLSIEIDDMPLEQAIEFGSSSEYATIDAGLHTILAKRAADGLVLYSGQITTAGRNPYTLVIGGETGLLIVGQLYHG